MPKISYKIQDCLNPVCPQGKFIPKRSDQKFCDVHCKDRYHILKNKKERHKERTITKTLRKIDLTLAEMYQNCQTYKLKQIPFESLQAGGIVVDMASKIEKVKSTGNVVHWFIYYGISGLSPGYFQIIKREN
ncbi:MAG TPA: hypothetical protein PKH65_02885 [Bacteroidia bacterium]|nr:hypothetical protein [Bacteroidia bacterium]